MESNSLYLRPNDVSSEHKSLDVSDTSVGLEIGDRNVFKVYVAVWLAPIVFTTDGSDPDPANCWGRMLNVGQEKVFRVLDIDKVKFRRLGNIDAKLFVDSRVRPLKQSR